MPLLSSKSWLPRTNWQRKSILAFSVYRGLKVLKKYFATFSPLPTLFVSVTSPKALHGAQHNTAHSKSEDGVLCHASRSWWYGSTSGVHGHHAWVIPSVYVCTHTRKTRVEEEHIYLDPRISFQEIDRYFLSGCACAFFQVATDVYTDLRYNQEEWD